MPSGIRFILNDREVETDAPAGLLVLDFLRECKRLTGTKEGCKEGDCGACAILIGELKGDAVRYQPVTSCLVPLAEVHGKHVVTIEGCNHAGLNPVQEAIVEFGGTQCGFCTPGIVVSLHGLLLDNAKGLSLDDVKYGPGRPPVPLHGIPLAQGLCGPPWSATSAVGCRQTGAPAACRR